MILPGFWQLICAVSQIHERGVCHGDIKLENVLVTSWNWVFLTDLANFKPALLPANNPADFSFFFDTGGRRRCYVAPERFYESTGRGGTAPKGSYTFPTRFQSATCVSLSSRQR